MQRKYFEMALQRSGSHCLRRQVPFPWRCLGVLRSKYYVHPIVCGRSSLVNWRHGSSTFGLIVFVGVALYTLVIADFACCSFLFDGFFCGRACFLWRVFKWFVHNVLKLRVCTPTDIATLGCIPNAAQANFTSTVPLTAIVPFLCALTCTTPPSKLLLVL